ncbi:thymidine phosphorylase [Aquicoccus sp. SCR17]|nr:thymidine phosphorylase [Carideicomes alvinocaridis]
MDARAIIARLRRGEALGREELAWFARGLADGEVSDAQAGAFAMGICLRGLDDEGRAALTLAMRDSGDRLHWDLPGPVLDKHSTGGVGDCVSLLLAPGLAACGAYVPMISGRGLGHTGGTLDKLEAIPGLSTDLSEEHFRDLVARTGCAIVSATADIAPADRRLYAVRDVTATVESLDLITASILSKKLAAGPDALVLDVKVGSGAFMKSREAARELATALVSTANAAGCPTSAMITDMSQPLASSLGNALEVAEVLRQLEGEARGPLVEIATRLAAELLVTGGLATDREEGAALFLGSIRSGAAAERFEAMVAAMGGPADIVSGWRRHLPQAPVVGETEARASGCVTAIDGEALGLAVVELGGGRRVESDRIDPSVGLSGVVRLGQQVGLGDTLARIHAGTEEAARRAADRVRAAITLGPDAPEIPPLVHERIMP